MGFDESQIQVQLTFIHSDRRIVESRRSALLVFRLLLDFANSVVNDIPSSRHSMRIYTDLDLYFRGTTAKCFAGCIRIEDYQYKHQGKHFFSTTFGSWFGHRLLIDARFLLIPMVFRPASDPGAPGRSGDR